MPAHGCPSLGHAADDAAKTPVTALAPEARDDEAMGTERVRIGYNLATTWLQIRYRFATRWLRIGYKVATDWLRIGYGLSTRWDRPGGAWKVTLSTDRADRPMWVVGCRVIKGRLLIY